MSVKGVLVAAIALSILSSSWAMAGNRNVFDVKFIDFPSGTKCSAVAPNSRVKVKKYKSHPRVIVKGSPELATFYCVLPNGDKVTTDLNRKQFARPKYVGGAIYANGRARLITNNAQGNMVSLEFTNVLIPAK